MKICEYPRRIIPWVPNCVLTVTILAFTYVPLNLATSLFGMNIQQLNGTGQQIWVFFITAVAALLIAGCSWLCSDRLTAHEAIIWYKERAAAKKPTQISEELKNQEYGLLLRIAMLVWLVRNGHVVWMWKSGAWAAILTNSNACSTPRRQVWQPARSACYYVSKYSSPGHSSYVELAFSLKPRYLVTWSTPLGYTIILLQSRPCTR